MESISGGHLPSSILLTLAALDNAKRDCKTALKPKQWRKR